MKILNKLKVISLFIVSLVVLILLVGCDLLCPECPEQEECEECPEPEECQECETCEVCEECQECEKCLIPEGKAMVNIDRDVYSINESDLIFDYWINNYGDTATEDIEVRCKLSDENGEVLVSETDSFGNLSSESTQSGSIVTEKSGLDGNKTYGANCYVESCSNCDILYKRIDDLVDLYE